MLLRSLLSTLIVILSLSHSELEAQSVAENVQQLAVATGPDKLSVLNELTTAYRTSSLDSSIFYARQAIELAATIHDSLLADAKLRICPSFYFQGAADSVRKYALSALEMGRDMNYPEITSYACQLIASSYEKQARYEAALRFNQESLDGYKSFNDTIGIGAISNNLSRLHAKMGELDVALGYALTAERMAEYTGRKVSAGLAAMNIAEIYSKLDKEDKTRAYVLKAKQIFNRDSFPRRYASVLEFTGSLHLNQGHVDSSIFCFEEALGVHQKLGDQSSEAITLGNLGSLYQELEAWDESYAYFEKSLRLKKELKDHNAIAYDLTNLGSHFRLQGKTDSAEQYYLNAMELAEEHNLSFIKETVTKQLFELYKETGQFPKALNYHQQYFEHQEKSKGLATQEKIADLEIRYETEKKERQIETLALQNELERSKTTALTAGIAGVILLSGLIIGLVLYRRKNERKIHRLEAEVHRQEKHAFDQEINFKTRQLTTHALHMVQKNKVLQEIKDELAGLTKSVDPTSKKALRALDRRIDLNLQSDEDWDTFKLYFEQTNQDFYANLAKVNSELSPTELRLCTLIKLNLNIKETAAVLNIAPTSVKTARHRLRKKLRLEQGQDLAAFIRQVA